MSAVLSELAKLKNWVAYERVPNPDNEGEARMTLINPNTGFEAKCDDAGTWGDYQAAKEKAKTLLNGGVCFMFGEASKLSGIAAINLKDCFKNSDNDNFDWDTGEAKLKPYAQEIVNLMNSYTEYLPGQGLRILFKLSRNLKEIDASIGAGKRNAAFGIEICDAERYFVFTGNAYRPNGIVKPVEDRTEQVKQVLSKYFTQQVQQSEQEQQGLSYAPNTVYRQTKYKSDIERFCRYENSKTGFSNLDAQGSFFPGLYCIAGSPSLGKTTFITQIADWVAANSVSESSSTVLFFSFEQGRFELVSKSLARLTAINDTWDKAKIDGDAGKSLSAIEIRKGRSNKRLVEAEKIYDAQIAPYVSTIECNFDTTLAEIKAAILGYMRDNQGRKPVVIIDYLQAIAEPADSKKITTKDVVDTHIRGLKNLQRDLEIVIVVISSMNRASYKQPVNYESLKESGAIEYSCDVIWGLQLMAISEKDFDTKDNEKESQAKKRQGEIIDKAFQAAPRQVELRVLKNRFGEKGQSLFFNYYPKYDLFEALNERPKLNIPEVVPKQKRGI